jgi:SynChlorMet cassette radical SAM/SPASM protein ScmE
VTEPAPAVQPERRVMRTPRSVEVEVTARCNLRCSYCYFFDNPDVGYRDLPSDEWVRFFAECGRLGVMDLTVAGGEPFLRSDLRELLASIVANRMRFAILSNGTLIDDSIASYIAGTGRCNYVQVSIDAGAPPSHDACRGTGSFEKAVRGLRTLQRHGIRAAVRVTIHKYNVDALEDTAQFLLEELGLPDFSTNSAALLGTCRARAGDMLLTVAQRQQAMEALFKLSDRYPGRISASAGPLAEARMWTEMEDARASGAAPDDGRGSLSGCGCPSSRVAVRVDGAFVPCLLLPHMHLGWMNRDRLTDVWNSAPALEALRRRSEIRLASFSFCRGCPYVERCTGNCPALSYVLTGQVDHPSPDACLRRYLRAGGSFPRAASTCPGDDPSARSHGCVA